mmetsp:Transcript_2266/g.5248  ORF Transcript_2266/g.5248 Transcript_2266/m.5248 type:complete len:211 (-) Transcript_2266:878-1510(-)
MKESSLSLSLPSSPSPEATMKASPIVSTFHNRASASTIESNSRNKPCRKCITSYGSQSCDIAVKPTMSEKMKRGIEIRSKNAVSFIKKRIRRKKEGREKGEKTLTGEQDGHILVHSGDCLLGVDVSKRPRVHARAAAVLEQLPVEQVLCHALREDAEEKILTVLLLPAQIPLSPPLELLDEALVDERPAALVVNEVACQDNDDGDEPYHH